MIIKEKFFDLISRTADDVNNSELTLDEIVNNFIKREEKYKKLLKEKMDNHEFDQPVEESNDDYNDVY